MTAPLTSPPTSAATVESIGPTSALAATEPTGNAAKVANQRTTGRRHQVVGAPVVVLVVVWVVSIEVSSRWLWWLWWFGGGAVDGGEPRGHDVVGVLGQVVADQGVEALVIAGQVEAGEGDELALAHGDGGGGVEDVDAAAADGADDQRLEQLVVGHGGIVGAGADDELTIA